MNIFHGNLKAVEKFRLGILYLTYKVFGQVLIHNTITSSEKSQYMRDKMPFTVGQIIPIFHVLAQINFLSRPETSF